MDKVLGINLFWCEMPYTALTEITIQPVFGAFSKIWLRHLELLQLRHNINLTGLSSP